VVVVGGGCGGGCRLGARHLHRAHLTERPSITNPDADEHGDGGGWLGIDGVAVSLLTMMLLMLMHMMTAMMILLMLSAREAMGMMIIARMLANGCVARRRATARTPP